MIFILLKKYLLNETTEKMPIFSVVSFNENDFWGILIFSIHIAI
jgi:hypothetical protein